jgi:hypothetical protein
VPEEGDDLGVVRIGAREIYDAVMETNARVQSLQEERDRTAETLKEHGNRLKSLERWRYTLPVSAVLTLGTMVAKISGLI